MASGPVSSGGCGKYYRRRGNNRDSEEDGDHNDCILYFRGECGKVGQRVMTKKSKSCIPAIRKAYNSFMNMTFVATRMRPTESRIG